MHFCNSSWFKTTAQICRLHWCARMQTVCKSITSSGIGQALKKKNQNIVLVCYYQPSELKSLQRAGKKVLRISTHRSACSELGGMLKIYKHQKWTKALFKTDVSLGMHQAKSSDCIQPVGLDPQNWKHLMHVLWVFIMSFGHVTSIFSS